MSSMASQFNFTDKKILVTGSGKGIGRAISIALWKAGCKVYALSRTKSTLDSLVQDYPDIIPITQDLSNWEETRAILENIEPLDGLVNNAAAVFYTGPALDLPKNELDRFVNNNLYSVINCTQVIAGKMVSAKKSGSIVNISSTGSLSAYPKFLGYNVTKAGVDMATKQFALELGPYNIRVNSVNLTLVMTELVENVLKTSSIPMVDIALGRTPMGRLPSIEEAVSPVLYMLSDHSAMVSGTTHLVDGGALCNITIKQ